MLFNKKIKYILEVLKLGSQQTIGGRPGESRQLDMDEAKFKDSLFEFENTHNPRILIDGLIFSYGKGDEIKFRVPQQKGEVKASEYSKVIKDRYFNPSSKKFIKYPKLEDGVIPNVKRLQSIVANNPDEYPAINPRDAASWASVLQSLFGKMEASDVRQQVNLETGDRLPSQTFWYITKTPQKINGEIQWVGPSKLKQARITVKPDGTISKTPFGGEQTYKWKYQAFTNKGEPIPYRSLKGGITFDQLKIVLHSDQAKAAAGKV